MENAMGKIVLHAAGLDGVQVNQVIVETDHVILDVDDELGFLEEFWYCLGCTSGLPSEIVDHVRTGLGI
jgi:hypothetical protein